MKRRVVASRIAVAAALGAGLPQWAAAQAGAKIPRIGVLRWGVPDDDNQAGQAGCRG